MWVSVCVVAVWVRDFGEGGCGDIRGVTPLQQQGVHIRIQGVIQDTGESDETPIKMQTTLPQVPRHINPPVHARSSSTPVPK